MTSLRHVLCVSLLFVVMGGTSSRGSSRQTAAKSGDLLVYYCQNLALVTVRVLPASVEVMTASRKVTLAETTQPSPARYSDGTATLSGLGELVRFEEPGAVYWCRIEPAEVPWQDARLRGIEFRAAGDPGWSIEIDSGVSVEFVEGQGGSRVVTRFAPVAFNARDNRVRLTTTSGTRTLALSTEQRPCHHSGSTMTLSVTVTLDGKAYSGCGRSLEP